MAARIENLSSSSVDIQLKDDYGVRSPYTITTGVKLLTVDGQDLQPFYHTFLKIYLSDLLSYDANNAQEVLIDPDAIINLDSNNIKHNVTILGVSGTYGGDIEPSRTISLTKSNFENGITLDPALIPGTQIPYDGMAQIVISSSSGLIQTVDAQTNNVIYPSQSILTFTIDNQHVGFCSFSVEAALLLTILRNATIADFTNGIDFTPTSGYYGLARVLINNFTNLLTSVSDYSLNFNPSGTVLNTIQIPLDTSTYVGFSAVSIARPSDLVATNIKHGVTIAGIEGSYAGGDIAIPLVTVTANELTFASGSYHVTPPQTPILYAYMEEVVIELPTNLLAANIKSGVTIAGISGTYTDVANNGATASDILSGKIAFVNGLQITGSLVNDPYTIPGSTLNFSSGNIIYYTTAGHVTDTITVTAPSINPKDIIYGTTIVGIAGELELSYFSVRSIPANTSISTSDTFYFDIVSTATAIGSTHSLKNWLSSTTYTTSQGISRSYTGLGNFYGINLYASGLSSTLNTYAFVLYDTGPVFDVIYSDVVVSSWGMTSAGWQKSEVHPLYAFTFTDRYCFENDFDSYVDNFMSTSPAAFGSWVSGGQVGSITVTPSVNSLIILPASANLDAFNEVDVDAIPYGETDNAAGGKTADIGDNVSPINKWALDIGGSSFSVDASDLEGITQVREYAFYYCITLVNVVLPSTVTSIGNYAFARSSLTSITMPNSVTSIGSSAFSRCSNLTSITIPDSVTSIGESAFYMCERLSSLNLSSAITSISRNMCYECTSLSSVYIPDGVTTIGATAFYSSGLTSVTFPSSLETIGTSAFSFTNLTSITCLCTVPPTITTYTFDDISRSIPVYVPASSVSAYQSDTYWSEFTNIQAIPS